MRELELDSMRIRLRQKRGQLRTAANRLCFVTVHAEVFAGPTEHVLEIEVAEKSLFRAARAYASAHRVYTTYRRSNGR